MTWLAVLLAIVVALVLVFWAAVPMARVMSPACPRCQRRHTEGELCAACQSELEAHHLRRLSIDLREKDATQRDEDQHGK